MTLWGKASDPMLPAYAFIGVGGRFCQPPHERREGVARLGTKMPFERAVAEVAFFWGVELEETSVRRHTQAAWRRLRRRADRRTRTAGA